MHGLTLPSVAVAGLLLAAHRIHRKSAPDAIDGELAVWGLVLIAVVCIGYLAFVLRKGVDWRKVVPTLRRIAVSLVLKLVAVGMLFGTFAQPQYGYYNLLRWVVCGVAGYAVFCAWEIGKKGWVVTFAVVAIAFNPVVPIRLDRGTWAVIDLAAAMLFLVSVLAVDRRLPRG